MPITPRKMARLLKKNGFQHVRTQGSHMFFKNPVTNRATTVPYHTIPYHTIPYHTIPYHSKTLGRGLEQAILQQAGLK
ncbi:HicA toxin [Listeria weihenstephanensis FSL R9-0317]|uniref:Toxin HicA n=3 Tax=Listeria weihenstephanensis TaxID=1006155 RepID=A0A1S7FQX5_9LIST|nr:hypothetical protein UE46_01220 [Listeria weihenstephanensis]EUJ34685.1 HicA toxin [Listeria weihenstephanensis FSL R9-0317]